MVSLYYIGLPKVTVNPLSQCVEVTQPVKLTTTISGVGKENFSYQWRHNGEDINGETSNALTIDSVTDDKVGTYDCVVMNEFGNCVTSNACQLCKYTMSEAGFNVHLCYLGTIPFIHTHPCNQTVSITTESFSLNCKAMEGKSYYWEKHNGSIPSGATGMNTDTLTIIKITPEDSGNYRCVVSNDNGKVYSVWAVVTVSGK